MAGRELRMRAMRGALPAIVAGLLAGCAQLPTTEAAAFKTIAASSQTSFQSLSDAEVDALKTDQLNEVASHQKTLLPSDSCAAPDASEAACFVVVTDISPTATSRSLALVPRTVRVQALITAISSYAAAMSDLAAAKDLDDANTATGKAAASLKTLAKLIPGPVGAAAGPAIDGLTFGAKEMAIQHRRGVMLKIATAAQPVMVGAAKALGDEAGALRTTLVEVRGKTVMATEQALLEDNAKAPPSSAADRLKLAQALVAATADDAAARALKTDFTALPAAHQKMIDALKDPKADVSQSMTDAQSFLTVLQSFAALRAPAPAKS